MAGWNYLYYVLPTPAASFNSQQGQFRLISLGFTGLDPQWNWILLAVNNDDNGLKWMVNSITFPKNLASSSLSYNSKSGTFSWLAPINNPTFTGAVGGITKAMVGLDNVDNTSDANKPVSTAMQNLLSNYPTIGTTLLSNYNTTTTTNSMLNSYLTKPWVGGRFNASLTTLSTIGQQSFTLSKPATGTYNVNWTTANPSGSTYAISVSVRGPLTASYGLPGTNGFQLYAYSVGTSVLMDIPQDISFFTLP
jgi:hypothetical protein